MPIFFSRVNPELAWLSFKKPWQIIINIYLFVKYSTFTRVYTQTKDYRIHTKEECEVI